MGASGAMIVASALDRVPVLRAAHPQSSADRSRSRGMVPVVRSSSVFGPSTRVRIARATIMSWPSSLTTLPARMTDP